MPAVLDSGHFFVFVSVFLFFWGHSPPSACRHLRLKEGRSYYANALAKTKKKLSNSYIAKMTNNFWVNSHIVVIIYRTQKGRAYARPF